MNIARLQSMAQIHSYYITNASSELKFSSSNLGKDELEIVMREITTAMINNDDLFDEEDNEVFSDSESINLDDENTNNLLMEEMIDLDVFEDSEERDEEENDENSNRIQPQLEDTNVDFEAILSEEFDQNIV